LADISRRAGRAGPSPRTFRSADAGTFPDPAEPGAATALSTDPVGDLTGTAAKMLFGC